MRFQNALAAQALSLVLPACAATISLSGTVTDNMTHGTLSGVKVSVAKESISTTTSSDGSWSLIHQGTYSGLSARNSTTPWTSHLSIQNGRIILRYGSNDLLGHAVPQLMPATSPATLARSATTNEMVDTILFSWRDTLRLRLPISSYVQSGITARLDASILDSTFGIPWNLSIAYGILADPRDGHVYRTVTIGTQTWMAQNLNHAGSEATVIGACYNNSDDSCFKYGRLYSWAEVMKDVGSSSASPSGIQGICPSGWHVPSDAEWKKLEVSVGMGDFIAESTGYRGTTEGTQFKSTAGWSSNGNGTDTYGFRVLPTGYRFYDGSFDYLGNDAVLWTTSEYDAYYTWYRNFNHSRATMYRYYGHKLSGYSLRCVQNP